MRTEHPEISLSVEPIQLSDAGEIMTLQRAAFVSEAQLYNSPFLAPLTQTLDEVEHELRSAQGWVARVGHRIVGAIRYREDEGMLLVGRIAVAPDMQGYGIGGTLLRTAEEHSEATIAELFTGSLSTANMELYAQLGYVEHERIDQGDGTSQVFLRKQLR